MSDSRELNPYHGGEYPSPLAHPVTETQKKAAGVFEREARYQHWGMGEFDILSSTKKEERR